ncbi:PIN domain-containing protein [Kitasatospora phosalacinea]|uniref:PIN domain-containing protein n=1 Tax=Kitasatospora phosalacinea TaxID=2065 RepID=A0A9W6USH4_9ACTN|nr:PIN domain-containing protein [Kitasatospora phosalacinea]GLW58137.1 hypothetical protein Kpho01_61480 [Kitasatospora phosalacinea]
MRLKTGTTFDAAQDILEQELTRWRSVLDWNQGRGDHMMRWRRYNELVNDSPTRLGVLTEPDLALGIYTRTGLYELLIRSGGDPAFTGMLHLEVERQVEAMQDALTRLEALRTYIEHPGLPVLYDTNMLNHWAQPSDVPWRKVLKDQGVEVNLVRLVVPLRVIDELDRQKDGGGDLGRKAGTAIRFLERTLGTVVPGTPVSLRPDEATLEVWPGDDYRGLDTDLAILRCAADFAALRPDGDVYVLTNDTGMHLRARQQNLATLRLPDEYKKGATSG